MSEQTPGSLEAVAMLLLEEALDQPSGEREAFIASRDNVSSDVRDLALALLRSEEEDRVSIRTGGAGEALKDDDDEIVPPDLPGYTIIRQLGRGGMGAVFLAERATRDFEQKVAIKVIKPGVLGDALVDRFRRERQILASLNHPHIAHLYDGGETTDGQPFIVMEYVQGRTLRDWMKDERPSLDRKLELFLQAAEAVEFAHQNLVIHRDLTPNNILVTDAEQAKLIDFGIARPHAPGNDEIQTSPLSGLSLTPGFAAPERSTGAISTTLTDIYSLGRILNLMIGRAGKPELEAIAAKAAAGVPSERYGSVSELIEEIENFRAKLPVTTYSNTASYRVRKFVSREKVLVGGVAGFLLAVLAGLAATGIAYSRAEEARQLAEQRFDGLRDLAHFQLFDLYDELNNVVGNTKARLALAERSQQYLIGLAETRSDDVGLQLETGEGFLRLALIQGIPGHPNFGEPDRASENLDRAQQIFERLSDDGIARADTGIALTEALRSLLFTHHIGLPDEGIAAMRRGEEALERVPVTQRDWAWMQARRKVRMAALEWADLQLDSDMIADYVERYQSDIEQWPQDKRGGYEEQFDRAAVSYYLGIIQYNAGTEDSYRAAVDLYLEADDAFATMLEEYPNDPMVLYWRAWNAYYGYAAAATLEDDPQATRLLGQARSSVEQLIRIEEVDNTLNTFDERLREAQAEYFSNLGRFDEAIALMAEIIDGRVAKAADGDLRSVSDLAYGRAIYGNIFRKAGRTGEACENFRSSESLMARAVEAGGLDGYIAELRDGVRANITICRGGGTAADMQPLT